MTWQEAVDYACPRDLGTGELAAMMDSARAALDNSSDLWAFAQTAFPPEVDASRMGIALVCVAAGLDAHARSLAQGKAGGRDLLVGDGLITRAFEIAAELGAPALTFLAEVATDIMGVTPASVAMLSELEEIERRPGFLAARTMPSSDPHHEARHEEHT